jgi:hypothetical protein
MIDPKELLVYFLPDGVTLERYDIADAKPVPDDSVRPYIGRLEFWLEEKNIVPAGIAPPGTRIESKGFFEPVRIYDFPVRNRLAKLVVRRRRWIDKDTGKYLSMPFPAKAEGTTASQELVDFLK